MDKTAAPKITKAALEAEARNHRCPDCRMQPHFGCRGYVRGSYTFLKRPHAARIAVAREALGMPTADGLKPGDPIPPEQTGGMPGFVVGECGHRVAGSEWRAGFRNCERCGG